ncbi:heparinase II/III family protein [Pseudomonas rustica]
MLTREILATATPEAYLYIKNTIKPDSAVDYQKLKRLFDSNTLIAKSFEDANLSITEFEWQGIDKDRNWWWQLQALPFLNWFVNSKKLQSDEETSRYFSMCLKAINCWIANAQFNHNSPLAWHDHASAYRARNLTNWMLFCITENLLSNEDERAVLVAQLITTHLQWLMDDNNYSAYTNHGFDQAMISLTIALMFEGKGLEPCRQLNRKRLINEISFAFTDQGVHKENSPGYQKMMLTRLKQLRTLGDLGDAEISALGKKHIHNAESFLRAVTMPNGNLPMLGDTRDGDRGLQYNQAKPIDIIDYSESGYVIVRGKVSNKDFHLIFKSSHLSNYHRHDDDLSLHIFYDGKVILGDGGLGSHNEKDPRRIALRSKFAHSVPHLEGLAPIRNISELQGREPSTRLHGNQITGVTFAYGNMITRQIDLKDLQKGVLEIRDTVEGKPNAKLACNFYIPTGATNHDGELVAPINEKHSLRIKPLSTAIITQYETFYSNTFGSFSDVPAFTFTAPTDEHANPTEIIFRIDLNFEPVGI